MNKHTYTPIQRWNRWLYCLILLLAFGVSRSQGATAIIGTGTSTTNGSTADPIERYYNYIHFQMVWTAAELTTAGMSSGSTITAMGFSVSESAVSLSNYTISMGLTSQTLANPYISSGLTVVKNSFTYAPVVQTAGNFDMITLDVPFVWDGTSSIVVNTCTGSNPFTSPYGGLRYTTATSGAVRYVRTDGSSNCATATGTNGTNRPNIRFDYTAGTPCSGTPNPGTVPSTAGYCVPGTVSIASTGYTTGVSGLSFQWEESDDDGAGDPWVNAIGGSGATTASYTSPSLTGAPIYYRLKVSCSGNDAYSNSCYVSASDCQFDVTYNTGISYSSIAGTGSNYSFPGTTTDDQTSNTLSLAGTTFQYKGQTVTGLKACTNGWITFNTASTSTEYSNNIGTSSTTLRAILAPFWEDLVCTGNPATTAGLNASMKYQIVGTLGSGSAQIICEWIGMETYGNAGPNLNFQVVLDENGNTITYNYGTMEGFNGSANFGYAYTIGMNGWSFATPGSYTDVMALRDDFTTNFDYTPSTTANSGLNSKNYLPACNSQYVFNPVTNYAGPGSAPTYAPGNDESGSAFALSVNAGPCTQYCGTYYEGRGATASSGIPVCSAGSPGTPDDDVWFSFNATTSSQTITVRGGGGYDAVVQLLDGSLNAIACVNATGTGLTETINATGLNPGDPYYIRVYHSGTGANTVPTSGYTTAGISAFSICVNEVVPPPANDDICGAVGLSVNTSCVATNGTSLTATASPQSVCGGTADDDVWYSFVAPTSNPVVTVQSGTGYNAHLQVYSSSDNTCTGTLTSLGCINNTSTGGAETFTGSGLTAGNTYFIRVYNTGTGPATGVFTVCVTASVPNCATSGISPSDGGVATSTSQTLSWSAVSGATGYDVYLDANAPATSLVSANQVGTTYVATVSGGNTYHWLVIPKNGIGDATGCAEYTFTADAPACLANPTSPTNGGISCVSVSATSVSWPSAPGATSYDVYFDAGSGPATSLVSPAQIGTSYSAGVLAAGTYAWKVVPKNVFGDAIGCSDWTFTVTPAPAGDVLGTAIPLTLPATGTSDNLSSNCWLNNFTGIDNQSSPDVFFTFTTGNCTDSIIIDLGGSDFDTYLHLLDNGGAVLESDDDDGPLATSYIKRQVSPNTQYYIVMEGYSTNTGNFGYTVTEVNNPAMSVSAVATDASCFGGSDGQVVVTASGGVAPYTGEGTFTGLSAGTYNYTVTDVNGCSASGSATVGEPTQVVATCTPTDATCPGFSDGSVTVSATGGTGAYTGTGTFGGLAAGTYNYTVTDANGCSASCSATIGNSSTLSSAPTGATASSANICLGNNVTLSVSGGSLGTGANWVWYAGACGAGAPIGTGASINYTPGFAGNFNYFVRAEGACNTTACASVNVIVSSGSPAGTISITSAPAAGCVGGSDVITTNSVLNATGYNWSGPPQVLFNGQPSPYISATNSVTVSYTALPTGGQSGWNICVQAVNACGASPNTKCTWIRATLTQPGAITGSAIACPSSSGTYSISGVAGAASYQWTATGAGMTVSGTGTSATVTFGAGFTSGTLCVSGVTSCGYVGASRCMTISAAPVIPGTISGPSTICPGGSASYSIAAVPGAASYIWSATGSGVTVVGSGTSATVSTTSGFTAGSVCVVAVSSCGSPIGNSAQRCKTISTGKLGTPGNITGDPINGVCGQTYTYSIPAMSGATSYAWSLPSGATGSSSTNSITVTFSGGFTTGQICVNGVNACGAGFQRCVTVNGNPSNVTGLTTSTPSPCMGTDILVTWNATNGASTYDVLVPVGYTVLSGTPTSNTFAIVNAGFSNGSIGIRANSSCGNSGTATLAITPVGCRVAGSADVAAALRTEVFPNPTTGTVNIRFNSENSDMQYVVNVTDLSGRVILSERNKASKGSNLHTLDLSGMAKGTYLVSLLTDNGKEVVRVTVE